MNFKVEDRFDHRAETIFAMLDAGLPDVAVISAAADFEWTLRRAIVSLGCSPNKEIHKKLERTSGLRRYAALWIVEVSPRYASSLGTLIKDWDNFVDVTYQLRHRLVHGAATNTSRDYAKPRVEEMLSATKTVVNHCASFGVDLYKRLSVRRNAWKKS